MVVAGGVEVEEQIGDPTAVTGGGRSWWFRESSGGASGCYCKSIRFLCFSFTRFSSGYPITVGGGGIAGTPRYKIGRFWSKFNFFNNNICRRWWWWK
jgi:hypothetical protein